MQRSLENGIGAPGERDSLLSWDTPGD